MKKYVIFKGMAALLLAAGIFRPLIVYGETATYKEISPNVFSVDKEAAQVKANGSENGWMSSYFLDGKQSLTPQEQAVVTYIEQYLTSYLSKQPTNRGLIGDVIDGAIVELAFDTAFKRESVLFTLIQNLTGSNNEEKPYTDWYKALTNTSERYQTVYDEPTGQNIQLYARYIDNHSEKTVVVHSGYRDGQNSNLTHVKLFSDMGYNVLIPDTRSHGDSEGEYITFGHYEKEDLTGWINQEVQSRPDQEIILFGISMGAATTMLSQATPHPNVTAYIEDCGYYSTEQQFHDILNLFTQFFKYIPLVKDYDWTGKEGQLINKLNEEKTKPILKMDIYQVAPINAVDKTGVPKLFIHGDADWFIPPVAQEVLYDKAIGYKEKLTVAGAEHGQSIYIDEALYTATVHSFLETVDNMTVKNPVVALDVNLLKNTDFETNETHLIDWETSTDNQAFSNAPLSKNGLNEFVLKKLLLTDMVTVFREEEGLRFFNRQYNNIGAIGQLLAVKAGETYELSFNVKNDTEALVTYPNVLYSLGNQRIDEGLSATQKQSKKLLYTAETDGEIRASIGAKLGYKTLISRDYTFTTFSGIQVVNADRTPPEVPSITSITLAGDSYQIEGTGEANTKLLLETSDGVVISTSVVTESGSFQLMVDKEQKELLHLISQDDKGNQSQSVVIVFQ
ncbi:serine aminopeptidase domain-containing protein [Enterococcus sp. LJL128]